MFVQYANENLALISQETAVELFALLGMTITNSKSAESKNDAKSIALFLIRIIGPENYYQQVQYLFQSQKISLENKRELEILITQNGSGTKTKQSLKTNRYNQDNQEQYQKFMSQQIDNVQIVHNRNC